MRRRVYIRPGVTDMRKSINTLTQLVQTEMNLSPFDKSLFIFCNKRKNMLKVLYWDKNGFCLWQKKLSKQKFPWVNTDEEVKEISNQRLLWLLKGIDFFKEHQEEKYLKV